MAQSVGNLGSSKKYVPYQVARQQKNVPNPYNPPKKAVPYQLARQKPGTPSPYKVPKAPLYTAQQFLNLYKPISYARTPTRGASVGVYATPATSQVYNPPVDYSGGGGGGGYYGGGGGSSGGGGGAATPAEVTWSSYNSNVQGAPSWWKGMKPSEMNADTEFIASMNALIPFLSEEDQKTVASTIYQLDGKNFEHLNPENIKINPATQLTTEMEDLFRSSERAERALASLAELSGAVGKTAKDLGPGYRYLRSLLDVSKQYGGVGTNRQTRTQYTQMMGALDPLLAQSKSGDLSPYGSLARMLTTPFFSGGQLVPVTRAADGSYVFGTPNKALF